MKQRKTVIVAFLLAAVLLLGVGYAALTDVLDITGSADVNQSAAEEAFNEDIYFRNEEGDVKIHEAGNTASVNADNNDKASFTAKNLKGKGDKATFTFTIVNDGDLAAQVTPSISSNTNAKYFKIYSDWTVDGQPQTKTLEAGKTLTYTVTMELIETPTETISGSCIIELTAVSAGQTNS